MKIGQIYESVTIRTPVDERNFYDYFNETLSEIEMMFDTKYTFKDGCVGSVVSSMEDEFPLMDKYYTAVLFNLLYLCGYGDPNSIKSEFIRLANAAHDSEKDKYAMGGKFVKRWGW